MKFNQKKHRGIQNNLKQTLLLATLSLIATIHPTNVFAATSSESDKTVYLDQGWDAHTRELYYYTPQGSRLIPYKWLQVLEQGTNTQLFTNPENLSKYGWITSPNSSTELNPGGLPIGFTLEPVEVPGTGKWAGLTCSACHTNNITIKGKTVRVDGAPGSTNFDTFFTDLSNAVQATYLDKDKFQRFIVNVLGNNPDPAKTKQLENEFLNFATKLAGQMSMRTPPVRTGPGRVDALAQIINALSVFDLQDPDNFRTPTAPVSFPFLWIAPKLDWVQWDPIANNPIARNAGEVLGVFGHANFIGTEDEIKRIQLETKLQDKLQKTTINLIPPKWRQKILIPVNDKVNKDKAELDKLFGHDKGMFASTVLYKNLNNIEQWLVNLKQPTWREDLFGSINNDLLKKGEVLFKQDCLSCHNMPPFAMTPKEENIIGKQFIKIGRINYKQVGTDTTYIENLTQRFTKTGQLGVLLFENQNIVPAGGFFIGSVAAVVEKGLAELGLSTNEILAYSDYRFYPPKVAGEKPMPYQPPAIDDLKAGPLLGIWATGPFLHNGSVPNLYELLSPPESRSKTFWVGNRELDTEKLGFVSTEQPGAFLFDTTLKGNGNMGHVYPAKPYTEEQRMAVIEYLKDPTRFTKETEK